MQDDRDPLVSEGECGLCFGGLSETGYVMGGLMGLIGPCPRCLTVTATDDIQSLALDVFGIDMWDNPNGVGPWDSGEYNGDCIPVYLDMGEALAVLVLTRRLQDSPRKPRGIAGPSLHKVRVAISAGWTNVRVLLASHGYEAPESWRVPADAPRALQRARSIVLALEVTA